MNHSKIPPSSAHIWGAPGGCTGWVKMIAKYPNEHSQVAKEGEAAHEIGAKMIESAAHANIGFPKRIDIVGKKAPNGVVYDSEMYDAALVYSEEACKIMRTTKVFGGNQLMIEHKICATSINPLSFGIPDFALFDSVNGEIYIMDFKYGYGVVDVHMNWQLINYVVGVMDEFGTGVPQGKPHKINFIIVQPRAFSPDGDVRTWKTDAEVISMYVPILKDNALEALGNKSKTHSGDHCRYCRARYECPAALSTGLALYECTDTPLPLEMSAQEFAAQYAVIQRAKEQLDYLESGYSEQLKIRLRSGENIPGYHFEETQGRLVWDKPVDEIIALGDMLQIDLKNKQAITPTQAKKKGLGEEMLKAYSTYTPGKLKIIKDNLNKVKEIFSHG